jgi:hypothetical protein
MDENTFLWTIDATTMVGINLQDRKTLRGTTKRMSSVIDWKNIGSLPAAQKVHFEIPSHIHFSRKVDIVQCQIRQTARTHQTERQ